MPLSCPFFQLLFFQMLSYLTSVLFSFVFLTFRYIPIFLSFLSLYHGCDFLKSHIQQDFMEENSWQFLDFRLQKQSLAQPLSCSPPRCLSWSPSQLSSRNSHSCSWDFLISSDLVTQTQLSLARRKYYVLYGGLSSNPLLPPPPTFVLFQFCPFFKSLFPFPVSYR